jgi:hypothetical protein
MCSEEAANSIPYAAQPAAAAPAMNQLERRRSGSPTSR